MTSYIIQNDFTHGELDRRLFSRADLKIYRKSAQKLRNVFVLPQGAASRRPGTEFIHNLDSISEHYQLADFESSDGFSYLLVLRDTRLDIYFEDQLQATLVAPWSPQRLIDRDVRFSQTGDYIEFTFGDGPPHDLVKISHPDQWILVNKNNPDAGFERYKFRSLPSFDFFDIDYTDFTFEINGNISIGAVATLTSTSPVFTENHVGGRFRSFGNVDTIEASGVAKITAFNSSTSVEITILQEFSNELKSGVLGSSVDLEEVAFSDERGWPGTVTFYEGRAWYGGTKSLPLGIFCSKINKFNDFSLDRARDDDGVFYNLATNKGNKIKYLVSDRSFQIFTETGEFTAPQNTDQPITPAAVIFRKQTGNGTENVEPIVIDNQTLYVRRGGKAVNSFVFDANNNAYQSFNASLFSPQLVRNPVDGDAIKASEVTDANFVFIVNNDGTLAVYQTLLEQEVSAWSLSTTDGLIKRVRVLKNLVYLIIEREINGSTVQSLEKIRLDFFTDRTIEQSHNPAVNVITGLEALEGKTVDIRGEIVEGEGFFAFPQAVVENGQITLAEGTQVVNSQVGLPYIPVIQPMPVNLITERGPALYLLKNLTRIFIDFYESLGIFVDDVQIPDREFNIQLDTPLTPGTGLKEVSNSLGWDERLAPTITQQNPLPMTILGIGYEVQI